MRYRSSKYGERTNVGTTLFVILPVAIVMVVLLSVPSVLLGVLIMIPVFILVNEACKRRRKNPTTGKWEWCPPQKGVNMWHNEGLLGS